MTTVTRRLLVGLVIVMITVLAGCTGPSQEAAPSTTPPVATPTDTPEPIPAEFDSLAFQANPERVARINDAMQRFGAVVLEQSRTRGSIWGPFDAYCAQDNPDGTLLNSGYTSQGYMPVPGDECSIQHNPQYGGPHAQFIAEVIVGSDGQYQPEIISAVASTDACTVFVRYADDTRVPLISVGLPPGSQSPAFAPTLDHARILDDKAVNCLDSTRP